jgi:hypothetical protein
LHEKYSHLTCIHFTGINSRKGVTEMIIFKGIINSFEKDLLIKLNLQRPHGSNKIYLFIQYIFERHWLPT